VLPQENPAAARSIVTITVLCAGEKSISYGKLFVLGEDGGADAER
jgi:hypothetical protein